MVSRRLRVVSRSVPATAAVLILVSLVGCQPTPTQTPLEIAAAAQVREYDGQTLSSITDSRNTSISGPRYVDPSTYTLSVDGAVNKDLTLTYSEVIGGFERHRKIVTLECEEGWGVTWLWEGVLVRDVLDAAGVSPDAKVAVFYSADGYSTSLPLDYLYDNDIIMADTINAVTLPPELGFPFQIVAEGKWGYKWSKWVQRIELSTDADYEGYWESRGFSDTANLDEPFLD